MGSVVVVYTLLWESESRTLRLALLFLLGIVLRLGLSFGQRVGDVLSRLVGETVIVDRLLCLRLVGDLDARVIERCHRTLFLLVEVEIDGAGLSLLIYHVVELGYTTVGVVILLLLGKRNLVPLSERLDAAVF